MATNLKQKLDLFQSSALCEVVPFRIAAAAVGPGSRLRVPDLIRLFQEGAMRNTVRLRVSSPELIAAFNLSWILRRQRIIVQDLPVMGQEVTVITAPSGFARRLQTFRDFYLVDAATEAVLAAASSQWLLMDVGSRRLRPIPDHLATLSDHLAPAAAHLEPPTVKVSPPANPDREHSCTIGYHQLDFNDHLTNSVFPELMLEPLGAAFLAAHQPRLLDIDFRAEARYADRLTARTEAREDGFRHGLYRGEDLLATMRSEWSTSLTVY